MKLFILLPVISLFISGCQSLPYQGVARNVQLKPKKNGIIAMPLDPRVEDRSLAEKKMTINCNPGKYEVLEEGEIVIGEKTKTKGRSSHRNSSEQTVGSLFGIPLTSGQGVGTDSNGEKVTSHVKEWQISYKCVGLNKKKTRIR